jgi:hypothetical protein
VVRIVDQAHNRVRAAREEDTFQRRLRSRAQSLSVIRWHKEVVEPVTARASTTLLPEVHPRLREERR